MATFERTPSTTSHPYDSLPGEDQNNDAPVVGPNINRQGSSIPLEELIRSPESGEDPSTSGSSSIGSSTKEQASPTFKVSSHHRKEPSIGLKTPLSICGCLLGGVVAAVGNYIFFRYLHHRQPSDSISQAWTQTIAVIFANLVRSLLGGALGIAYVQHLWSRFRKKWMKAKLIDQLLTLPWNPLDLLDWKAIWAAKFEWLFALFCVLLPLATAIPPGSLRVVVREVPQRGEVVAEVPFVNLTYRRDERYDATESSALFRLGSDLDMASVKSTTQVEVTNVLRVKELTMWKDPAPGRNSSYSVQFTGPKLRCEETRPAPIPSRNGTTDKNGNLKDFPKETMFFLPSSLALPSTIPGSDASFWTALRDSSFDDVDPDQGVPSLEVWYRPEFFRTDTEVFASEFVRTRCFLGLAEYVVSVRHSIGKDPSATSYKYLEGSFKPIVETSYSSYAKDSLMSYYMMVRNETTGLPYRLPYPDPSNGIYPNDVFPAVPYDMIEQSDNGPKYPFWRRYLDMQSLALGRAFISALEGGVRYFGHAWGETVEGNILATAFANTTYSTKRNILNLDLSPARLEEAFGNVTVSLAMMGLEGYAKNVSLTVNDWTNVYEFSPVLLVGPYLGIIVVSFIFSSIGLYGLYRNGVAAKGSSFLQIVTTTAAVGGSVLREKAAECCEGGEEAFSKELLGLRLKYGELVRRDGEEMEGLDGAGVGSGAWGFGTYGEVQTIRRR